MIKNRCRVCNAVWETEKQVNRCKNCGRPLTGLKTYKFTIDGKLADKSVDKNRIVFVDSVDKKVDKLIRARNVYRGVDG